MKKYFLSIVALAGMLFATSCQESLVEPQMEGPTTFSVQLPDAMGTKATIGSKENVNQLLVAVYSDVDNDQQPLVCRTVEVQQGTGRFDVSFDLIKGQTYDLIFWAQTTNAYVAKGADDYDLRSIQMNANYPNNENGAAFFHFENNFKVDGVNATITLRRPFAQLNLRTTEAGLKTDANSTAVNLSTSMITVTNVATHFNTVTGQGEGSQTISFAAAAVPQEDVEVDGVKYKYVSMNYLPVEGDDRALVDVTAVITLAEGPVVTHNFTNIPLQENYRTNIMGNLISGKTNFEVIVNDDWSGDNDITNLPYFTVGVEEDRYNSFIDAYNNALDGDVIKINGGIPEINATADIPYVTIDKNITLDLNGYGLNASIPDVTVNTMIFRVLKGAQFTIIGEGNVHLNTAKCVNKLAALISNEGGIVNIESGNYTITALEYPDALIPTFIDNNSTLGESVLNIKGGKFTYHRNLFRNFANNKSAQAIMKISGGEFNGLPYDEGAIWNQRASSTVPGDAGVINVTGGVFNNVVIDDEFAGVVYANTQEEMNTALSDPNTHTIMLGAGEFVADMYNGTPSRKSLTIIGSEGTRFGHTATTGGQLRLKLFDSFTIRNCEIIQRSGFTWGHIVFASGEKANGVYTIENCTFTGVGTQGIYINENTTGATYNILNCTFNGDFGTEGAITIQTNKDVNHIVNVEGCEFNNIPATSHRIFLARSTAGLFYDFTLNTDLEATTDYEIETFIKLGLQNIRLAEGTYIIPMEAKGKTLTFIGVGNVANTNIEIPVQGSEGCAYSLDGSTVRFENISINTTSITYTGYARMNGTYVNCIINGTYTLYGDSSFEGCTFNVSGDVYNIWTWGAPKAVFNNCTFNSDGKAMLLYGQANTQLTINNSIFNDNGGLPDLKAAIEIGNDYNTSYNLVVNNTKVYGYEINPNGISTGTTLWANKNSMPEEKLNVVVDGVDVY